MSRPSVYGASPNQQVTHGETVQLVSWSRDRNGDPTHEIVTGRLLERNSSSWRLVVRDHVVVLPRQGWELCLA